MNTSDRQGVLLLILLCLSRLDTLQGVPLGLTFGSVPFLLSKQLSYAQMATFSLATYPYSLKLLWSPIVDSVYVRSFGRRKSWIVPMQLLTGSLMLWLGWHIDELTQNIEAPGTVWFLSVVFFGLVLLSATQDIAVDGWALTLLSEENITFASTAQTIGLNIGYFISFTIFLVLNSAEACNKWLWFLRDGPSEKGILELSQYLVFWGYAYFAVTAMLLGKMEDNKLTKEDELGVTATYVTMWDLLRLPHLRTFLFVMLFCKIGFITNDAVTALKLMEKGFPKEDLALNVLVDFPLQLIFGYYAAKWSTGERPLRPWMYAFFGRALFAVVGMLVVHYFNGVVTNEYFLLVMVATVLSSFMSLSVFPRLFHPLPIPPLEVNCVTMCTYLQRCNFSNLGTYMTFLQTINNFGGTWPRYFILLAVEYFTDAPCMIQPVSSDAASQTSQPYALDNVNCGSEVGKHHCKEAGGQCEYIRDGYYYVNTALVVLGMVLFFGFIQSSVERIQKIPIAQWRLAAAQEKREKTE